MSNARSSSEFAQPASQQNSLNKLLLLEVTTIYPAEFCHYKKGLKWASETMISPDDQDQLPGFSGSFAYVFLQAILLAWISLLFLSFINWNI